MYCFIGAGADNKAVGINAEFGVLMASLGVSHEAVGIAHFPCRYFIIVGGWNDCGEAAFSWFVDVSSDVCVSIASSGMSSSSGLVSLLPVPSSNNASAA